MDNEIGWDISRFHTSPPLPIEPVGWKIGWSADVFSEFKRLDDARRECVSMLFESESAPPSQLEISAQKLCVYGRLLYTMCRKDNSSSQAFRRSTPLVFSWCFPAETVQSDKDKVSDVPTEENTAL